MDAEFCELSFNVAKPFIEKWHYSGCVPKGRNIFFGLFLGGELYAVADYGNGVNVYQAGYLARVTGLPVTNANLVELKRLVRSEPKLDFPLTRFISICNRALVRKGYFFVVSFSDPYYNHNGGIYKAASFAHLGKTNAEWHLKDRDGVLRHRRLPYRYSRRNGTTIAEARDILKLTRFRMPPKDRWFLALGCYARFQDQLRNSVGESDV